MSPVRRVARARAELVPSTPVTPVWLASVLVDDAVAGVVIAATGPPRTLTGLPRDPLLEEGSPLLAALGPHIAAGWLPGAFLWPRGEGTSGHEYVRVTFIVLPATVAPDVRAVVTLSAAGNAHGLTARELEVLGLMVAGCSNGEIARELVITARTVATHVEHLLAKLSCPSRMQAAVRAQREGLYVPASRAPQP